MKLVILSRDRTLYSTRRLVEAAKKRGHSVRVIDYLKCYVVIEKGNPSIHYKGKSLVGVDAVIPRIGAARSFYGTAIVRQFEMMKVFCANESQSIVRSRDKLRSLQILARAGLGMPVTAFASDPSDIEDLIEKVGGAPLIIKLIEGTQGIGVVLAETRKAAKSVLEAFYGLQVNILMQEFIKEAGAADIRAFVIDGHVVGAMRRQADEGEFRSNIHRGGSATPIELNKEEEKLAVRAAKALGLSIAGVDMLQSKRGPLIMEVNSSPGLEGIESATKLNIAGKIIKFVEWNAQKRGKTTDKIKV